MFGIRFNGRQATWRVQRGNLGQFGKLDINDQCTCLRQGRDGPTERLRHGRFQSIEQHGLRNGETHPSQRATAHRQHGTGQYRIDNEAITDATGHGADGVQRT